MDQRQGPSLLEYARFHGMANPSSTVNPLEYIDQILENSPFSKDEFSPASSGHTTTPWESIKRQLNSEKLNLSKNDAQLLSTVIRDMRAERVQVNWDDCLPLSPRIEGLKVELPVLTTHHESDMMTLTGSGRSGRGNEALSLLQTCLPYSLPKSSTGFNMGYEIEGKVKKERLNCTKESFLLIQNARKCGNICPAMDCLETHLQAYGACRGSGPALTPIDFDELYSPSPSPKPQMLPSPASSNPIKRHESPIYLQKAGALVSIPLEFGDVGGTRARGSEDEQSSNVQREEEVRFFQEYSMPMGHASSSFREVENTKDLFHPPDSTWNFAQSVVSTRPDVELAPGRGFSAHRQPTCFLSTLQSDPCFIYREAVSDRDIDVGHSVEVKQGIQDPTGGKILKTPKPAETSHGGDLDSMVVDENWCESNTRANKQLITANDSFHNAISIPDGPALVTETCRQQAQERLNQTSNHQQKRKKERDDHRLKKKQHRDGKKRPAVRPAAESQGLNSSSPFTALGSLPAFMETRCIAPKRRVNAESPCFATKNQPPIDRTEPQELVVSDQHAEPVMQCEERVTIKTNTPASHHNHIPQYSRNNKEPPLLFLSTSLLKSHLRLTRTLENTKDPPPRLIYRDYDTHTTATSKTLINHNFQHEADIIISPSTGIILTTSQATTQLYLPGHKATHPHLDGIKGINSPLRERIMLLAPRYERLYVLVSHAGGVTKKQPTADERTMASMTSLIAFCNSVSEYSTIIPLIIAPSTPETMAQWILGLAYKHPFRLPETSAPRSIGFTPINPTINKSRIDPAMIETETQWELFLRRAGLNPFAAQIVLLVLREEDKQGSGSTYDHATVPALSRFAETSNETRRCLFAGLIGERVLKRVKAIMNNDWQCN